MIPEMKRSVFVAIVSAAVFCTLLPVSSNAYADCGDVAKQLLNVEVGGARGYVGKLPSRLSLSLQQSSGDSGVDMMKGNAIGRDLGASVYWHKDSVYMVLVQIRGKNEHDIDTALRTVLSIAKTDFDPNPKLVPIGEYLRCNDGLAARVFRSQIVQSSEKQVPILVVNVYHPKLKLRHECGVRPEQCHNLPKGYLD